MFGAETKRASWIIAGASASLLGVALACSVAGSPEREHEGLDPEPPAAQIYTWPEPGRSCDLACFDVQSSADVSVVLVDAVSCGGATVELSLFTVDSVGEKTWVSAVPKPYGNAKSCPDVPSQAVGFDNLSGKHLAVCTTGAERVRVFVKSGKTCALGSFEVDSGHPYDRPTDWLRQMGPSTVPSDELADGEGSLLYAQLDR